MRINAAITIRNNERKKCHSLIFFCRSYFRTNHQQKFVQLQLFGRPTLHVGIHTMTSAAGIREPAVSLFPGCMSCPASFLCHRLRLLLVLRSATPRHAAWLVSDHVAWQSSSRSGLIDCLCPFPLLTRPLPPPLPHREGGLEWAWENK